MSEVKEIQKIEGSNGLQSIQVSPIQAIQQLAQAGITPADMKQMLDLQKEYEAHEARKAYFRAVSAFKAEAISIHKDKEVGYKTKEGAFVGYKHASLGNIIKTAVPFMSDHGLSHSWSAKQADGRVSVTCILSHRDGHSEEVTLNASPDSSGKKNAIQQVASAITYLERYTFLAITGLAVEEQDDDGVAAGEQITSEPEVETILPELDQTEFDQKASALKKAIDAGRKTPEQIIATLQTKYALSDAQIKTIESYGAKK